MNWENVQDIFKECKELLGNPDIRLVPKDEWAMITDESVGDNVGMSSDYFNLITVVPDDLSASEIREVTFHEIAHIIFPKKPHWWIECCASKIAKTRDWFCYHAERYGHTKDELPNRARLIEMARTKVGE